MTGTAPAVSATVGADSCRPRRPLGLGRRLTVAGAAWARREHIAQLTATMSADNASIHRLLAGLGLPTHLRYASAGVSEIIIDLVAQTVAA